jgi:hypothetical protein
MISFDVMFWDKNLGSIIVGVISFSAVIIGGMISYYGGRRNIENQLKTQILTTINNEHIKVTREQISEILFRITFLMVGVEEYALIEHTYIDDIKVCYKAYFILTTLLDDNVEIEKTLLMNTKTLVLTVSNDIKSRKLEDHSKYEAFSCLFFNFKI